MLQATVDEQLLIGSAWQWLLNGTEIFGDQPQQQQQQLLTVSQLFINDADRAKHEGEYSCRFTTRLETITTLPVPVQIFARSLAVVEPARQEVVAGQAAWLACTAQVDARLEGSAAISWHKDGQLTDLMTSADSSNLQSVIQINSVQLSDSGSYSCHVRTPLDEAASSAQLVVRRTTEASAKGGRVQRFAGQAVDLPCSATVDPDLARSATVLWYKDGNPVVLQTTVVAAPSQDNQLENNLRLNAAVMEDEGDYICRIKTSLETLEVKYRLDIYSAPREDSRAADEARQLMLVAGQAGLELACQVEIDPRLAGQARIAWSRDNTSNLGLGRQSMLSDTGTALRGNTRF
jgi:Immunoglobulin domain